MTYLFSHVASEDPAWLLASHSHVLNLLSGTSETLSEELLA